MMIICWQLVNPFHFADEAEHGCCGLCSHPLPRPRDTSKQTGCMAAEHAVAEMCRSIMTGSPEDVAFRKVRVSPSVSSEEYYFRR
jgi:hypothetical protein